MKTEVLSPFGLLGRGIRGLFHSSEERGSPSPGKGPLSQHLRSRSRGPRRTAGASVGPTGASFGPSTGRSPLLSGSPGLEGGSGYRGRESFRPFPRAAVSVSPQPLRPAHTHPVSVAGWAGLMKEHPCVCMRTGDGPGRERVSHPSISLWRILAEEERWGLSPSKATIGWVIPTSERSKYQREEGGQASGCSSGTHGPIWGCLDATTCRLAHPASSLAHSSDGRVRLKKAGCQLIRALCSVDSLSLVATENRHVALLTRRSLGRI